MAFRAEGVIAAVQIQDYHGDRNPQNHTPQDSYDLVNQNYFVEQVKATAAIASQLAVPIRGPVIAYLPLVLEFPGPSIILSRP